MTGTEVGPYTIVGPLGEGGTGSVYLAEHTVLKTRRAVKLLSPHLTQNAALAQRFVEEARATARLHHRNLVQVHDIGQLASGAWFMVLDYLDGHTLARFMARRRGPLPPQLIIHILCEIANGLQVAHQHELAHRDLTPDNIFLISREGDPHHVVLLDLGVAERGTPAYMSADRLSGGRTNAADDIFALGVIAYQMSTGGWFPYQHGESHAGYRGLTAGELCDRQRAGAVVDPRDRWPSLGSAWVEALLAALGPDAARRPTTAGAFAIRLAEAVPPVGLSPSGIEIVRTYARELVDGGAGLDTMRMLRPPAPPLAAVSPAAGPRYQLGALLGTGGMAEVFAGTMIGVEGFARPVAIKRVRPGLSSIPAFASRFVTEAQIASRLSHSNIVPVFDFSRDSEGRLFLVMEHVDGKDLASLLEHGPIAPSLAIFIAVEMLRGLGHAHDLADPLRGTRGVIHRDVSPQNLLLSREGAVKVSDFGLAKMRAATSVCSDTIRGKPGYMSPEQCAGEVLDARSDLYSVGVMLWEMLAHRALFVGSSKEIVAQVLFKDIAAPSSVRGRVPADLEAVAMTLLARDRAGRYPTAQAAIEALLGCADAPRDGRGELAAVLAERFPQAGGAVVRPSDSPGITVSGALRSEPSTARCAALSVGDDVRSLRSLPSPPVPSLRSLPSLTSLASLASLATGERWLSDNPAGAPARCESTVRTAAIAPPARAHRALAALVSGAVLACVAAAVLIARGEAAQSGSPEPGPARPIPATAALPNGVARAAAPVADAPVAAARPPPPRSPPTIAAAPRATTVASVADPVRRSAELPVLSAVARPVASPALLPPTLLPPAPAQLSHGDRDRATRTGELAILVRPWAMIWLNGRPSGQTPFRAPVPVGRYRVRLSNDDVGQSDTMTVVVEADRTTTVERSW